MWKFKKLDHMENLSKSKRRNTFSGDNTFKSSPLSGIPTSEEGIRFALQRFSNKPDLIEDFSKTFCLPMTLGRHQDLKSITPATLVGLMTGQYANKVVSFKIIDCRYPYEYDGGHIKGAINIYTKDQCLELLHNENDPNGRHLLIFHCEFSSKRGPTLYRFLRKADRDKNKEFYPKLTYPEIYLLNGGYKHFYEQFSDLCVPEAYRPMLDPENGKDLHCFRQRSNTWNADSRLTKGQIGKCCKKLCFS